MFIEPEAQLIDLLALAMVPGLGPRLTTALLARFGSAAAVRSASSDELRTVPHIGIKLSMDFANALREVNTFVEIELLRKHNVGLVNLGSPAYPRMLAEIHDPPHLLFRRGHIEPADAKAIAVVGSRNCTSYGIRAAERISSGLVRAGYTVVSGLARGIDGAAHSAALKSGGRTIAVLAGGMSRIYPPEHADLADRVEASGAMLTETSMRQSPQAGMFPARNRLISGLSLGVVVVEANERSGALITAKHALDQNREVFAVPGQVDSPTSSGCLRLIRDGAKLVRNADDIIEDLGGVVIRATDSIRAGLAHNANDPELPPDEARVFSLMRSGPQHIDQIAAALEMPIADLARVLMQLELKRVIRRLPGNQYEGR